MIQQARSRSSRSLLREAETAIFLLENENAEKWFENAVNKVIEKRKDPDKTMTGATTLRTDLLSYLSKFGEVKTANIWCRNVVYAEIKDFLNEIKKELKAQGFIGVVELHLQDREINSPHIQYVGIDAKKAELAIANIIIKRGYEDNLENCIMINHRPAYIVEDKKNLRIKSTDEEVAVREQYEEQREKINEIKNRVKNYLDEIDKLKDEFKTIFKSSSINIDYISKKTKRVNAKKDVKTLIDEWKEKAVKRKARRR